jgi:hypothetical protein
MAQITTLLSSTLALLSQFQETLTPARAAEAQTQTTPQSANAKPLTLLSTSSAALRAQVTKLSLLAITTPFTPSALTTVLRAVNDSVLPSLVTAALLITPAEFTRAFQAEILVLARRALAEFAALVTVVKGVAEKSDAKNDKDKREEMAKGEKDTVTVAAGRVWEACDSLSGVAGKGVVGFVVRRVEQWRDLVRDAVSEIEEWDPEDEDDFFDMIGEEKEEKDHDQDEDEDEDEDEDDDDSDNDTAAQLEHKKSTLRLLKIVAQFYPALIKYRLQGVEEFATAADVGKVEILMSHLEPVSDLVDEAAGALYEDDWERAVGFLSKIRNQAAMAANLLERPWDAATGAGDKYLVWEKTWLKVLVEIGEFLDE